MGLEWVGRVLFLFQLTSHKSANMLSPSSPLRLQQEPQFHCLFSLLTVFWGLGSLFCVRWVFFVWFGFCLFFNFYFIYLFLKLFRFWFFFSFLCKIQRLHKGWHKWSLMDSLRLWATQHLYEGQQEGKLHCKSATTQLQLQVFQNHLLGPQQRLEGQTVSCLTFIYLWRPWNSLLTF